jgi:CheY-like chemotaxis protein
MFKVLVLDDDALIVQAVTRLLRSRGFEVRGTTDPDTAMDLGGGWAPHAVICDERMPQMTGQVFLAGVRIAWPQCVRILITGLVHAGIDASAYDRVFQKPWASGVLEEALGEMVRVRWPGGSTLRSIA